MNSENKLRAFKDKVVFLVSSQHWEHIPVSKHHYAETLSGMGVQVYFITPPLPVFFKCGIRFNEIRKNLTVIDYHIPVPYFVKFKFRKLFDLLVHNALKKTLKKTGKPNFLSNFDNETFFSQEYLFKDSFNIFQPVDAYTPKRSLRQFCKVFRRSLL